MFLFFVAVAVCSKKDLSLFIKMGSFGAFFVTMLIIFIATTGFMALGNTKYQIGSAEDNLETNWANPVAPRTIILFN